MPNRKVSELTELAATPAADDEVYIRDISEAAADESKRITVDNLLGGVARSATLVVAASDAASDSIAGADFRCDGTADDVQIQAAWDAMTAAGIVGTVQLSEGTFTLAASINREHQPHSLIGQGRYSTILTLVNGVDDDVIKDDGTAVFGGLIAHLGIDGNSAGQTAGHGIHLSNTWDVLVDDVSITDCKQHGFYNEGASRSTLRDSWIRLNKGVGLFVDTDVDGFIALNCWIGDNGTVGGTFSADSGTTMSTAANVALTGASAVSLIGNIIFQPGGGGGAAAGVNVLINTSTYVIITGGTIFSAPEEQLLIGGHTGAFSNNITVSGVLFHSASENDGSDYHIALGGRGGNYVGCFSVTITGNAFSQTAPVAAAGIIEEAEDDSTNNQFSNNNVKWQHANSPVILMNGLGSQGRNNNGFALSGDAVTIRKAIDHADLTDDGGATGRIDFDDGIPAGSIIKAVQVDYTEAWNSDNTTTLTMMIGRVGDLDAYNLTADPGENAFNTTTDVFWGESDCQAHRVTAAATPRVTFTEDNDITHIISGAGAAGKVTIYITYMKA